MKFIVLKTNLNWVRVDLLLRKAIVELYIYIFIYKTRIQVKVMKYQIKPLTQVNQGIFFFKKKSHVGLYNIGYHLNFLFIFSFVSSNLNFLFFTKQYLEKNFDNKLSLRHLVMIDRSTIQINWTFKLLLS